MGETMTELQLDLKYIALINMYVFNSNTLIVLVEIEHPRKIKQASQQMLGSRKTLEQGVYSLRNSRKAIKFENRISGYGKVM